MNFKTKMVFLCVMLLMITGCNSFLDNNSTKDAIIENSLELDINKIYTIINRIIELPDGGEKITVDIENKTGKKLIKMETFISYSYKMGNGRKWNNLEVMASENKYYDLKDSEKKSLNVYIPDVFDKEKIDKNYLQVRVIGCYLDESTENPFELQLSIPIDPNTIKTQG